MKIPKLLLLGIAALGLSSAHAQTVTTWNNTGTDWATGANWDNGAPVSDLTSSIATFNTATYTFAPTLGSAQLVNGLAVGSSSGATVTLGGAFTLTVGSGGIDLSAAGANLTATTPTIVIGAAPGMESRFRSHADGQGDQCRE